jgi:hypothetical protein
MNDMVFLLVLETAIIAAFLADKEQRESPDRTGSKQSGDAHTLACGHKGEPMRGCYCEGRRSRGFKPETP